MDAGPLWLQPMQILAHQLHTIGCAIAYLHIVGVVRAVQVVLQALLQVLLQVSGRHLCMYSPADHAT